MTGLLCPRCDRPVGPDQRFCTACGQALPGASGVGAPRRRWRAPLVVVLVLAAAVGGGALAAILLSSRPSAPAAPAAAPVPAPVAAPSPVRLAPPPGADTTSEPTDEPTTSAAEPADGLATTEAGDAGRVTGLMGAWVPQLSSKKVGMVADGITYGPTEILADHQRLRATYPQALLLRSDRFASFPTGGFWVTVVAQPYATPDEANAWCGRSGLPPDGCFAKRLDDAPGDGVNAVGR